MSDPAPLSSFGDDATEENGDHDGDHDGDQRHVVLRTLLRLRSVIVLVPLVAGLLVAAGVGAGMLWADLPQKTVSGTEVTCWDGRSAPLTDCSEPRGPWGVHWVFPSYRPGDERCERVRTQGKASPYDIACHLRLDQRSVTVTYAVRGTPEGLLKAVRRSYGIEPVDEARGERLVFRAGRADSEGIFRVTVLYADHPFAVTVEAPDRRLRDTALDELVSFRPADQVLVRQR
jgi:hypothetical protein